MDGAVQAYVYEPLPGPEWIRILTVRPSVLFDSAIHCELEAVLRNHDANYTALSYSWAMQNGDASYRREICVGADKKVIMTTLNLYEALQHLRKPSDQLRIWVDAVCINQEDLRERTAQVSNMGAVYKHARQTVAWLGVGDPVEDALMHSLLKFTAELYSGSESGPGVREWKRRPESSHGNDSLPRLPRLTGEASLMRHPKSTATASIVAVACGCEPNVSQPADYAWYIEDIFDVLEPFLKRRYFTRRWVLQELIHSLPALRFQWRHHTYDEDLSVLGYFCSDLVERVSTLRGFPDIEDLRVGWLDRGWMRVLHAFLSFKDAVKLNDRSLWTMMSCSDGLDSADVRDRIYSLISIDPSCDIVPDYDADLPAVDTELSKYTLRQGQTDLFCANMQRTLFYRDHNLGLPSWVMN